MKDSIVVRKLSLKDFFFYVDRFHLSYSLYERQNGNVVFMAHNPENDITYVSKIFSNMSTFERAMSKYTNSILSNL